jgi:hypothetical protein
VDWTHGVQKSKDKVKEPKAKNMLAVFVVEVHEMLIPIKMEGACHRVCRIHHFAPLPSPVPAHQSLSDLGKNI